MQTMQKIAKKKQTIVQFFSSKYIPTTQVYYNLPVVFLFTFHESLRSEVQYNANISPSTFLFCSLCLLFVYFVT